MFLVINLSGLLREAREENNTAETTYDAKRDEWKIIYFEFIFFILLI